MNIRNLALVPLLTLTLTVAAVHAETLLTSIDDQSFTKNQAPEQIYDLTLTETTGEISITQGSVKITIPDSIQVIFDDEETAENLVLYGSAVDNGKIEAQPEISFEDKDKTLVIPVLADFESGELVVISKIFIEGFHSSPSQSANLTMTTSTGATVTGNKGIYIFDDSKEDTSAPESPSDVVLENTEEGILVSWTDPSDLDLQTVDIYKGKGATPSGEPIVIADGVEQYLDTDVELGVEYHYVLKGNDGLQTSELNSEYKLLREIPEVVVVEEPEVVEEIPEVVEEPEVIEEEPEVVEEPEEVPEFSDTKGHWGKAAIEAMAKYQVVTGDPDGKFRPNDGLNRAEGAAMIYRIFSGDEPSEPSIKPFSDTELGSWFVKYLSALKGEGLVNGNPDGTFKPGSSMNRAEFLTLAVNLYLKINDLEMEVGEITADFADLPDDVWYADMVTYAYGGGYVEGSACGDYMCFNPEAGITRAEAAAILDNVFGEMLAGN